MAEAIALFIIFAIYAVFKSWLDGDDKKKR